MGDRRKAFVNNYRGKLLVTGEGGRGKRKETVEQSASTTSVNKEKGERSPYKFFIRRSLFSRRGGKEKGRTWSTPATGVRERKGKYNNKSYFSEKGVLVKK